MKTQRTRAHADAPIKVLVRKSRLPGLPGVTVNVVKSGKWNAYLRVLGHDPKTIAHVRHNPKIKLRLV